MVEGVIVEREFGNLDGRVYIGQSTKHLSTARRGEISYGRIPAGSVVVSRKRCHPKTGATVWLLRGNRQAGRRENAFSKVGINELLRKASRNDMEHTVTLYGIANCDTIPGKARTLAARTPFYRTTAFTITRKPTVSTADLLQV